MNKSHNVKFLTDVGIVLFNNSRITILDAEFYHSLWQDLVHTFGIKTAQEIFVRFGYSSGYADAIKFYELIHREAKTGEEWLEYGLELASIRGISRLRPLTLQINKENGTFYAVLEAQNSFEAEQHRMRLGLETSSCFFLSGYISGFASMNMDREIYFQETSCMGNGDPVCVFVGKPANEWPADNQIYTQEICTRTKEDKFQTILRDLKISEKKYKDLYDNAPLMYFSIDKTGTVIDCNRAGCELLGYTYDEIVGHHITKFLIGYDSTSWSILSETDSPSKTLEGLFIRKDRTNIFVSLDILALSNEFGSLEQIRCTAVDVSDRKRLERKLVNKNKALEKLNKTDSLTKLYNRRYLMEVLESEFEKAKRYDYPLSIIILDLDRFKQVNDYFGHQVGDDMLRKIGSLLHKNVRRGDIAARFGGEEFVILAPHASDSGSHELAEKIRKIIEKEASLEIEKDVIINTTASFGVSTYCSKNFDGLNTLIRAADDALLKSKRSGRNKVTTADAKAYS